MHSNTAKITSFSATNALGTIRGLVALVVLLVCSIPLCGQGSNGRILGAVTDQSGGNVVGATVTITDVARGVPKNLVTDQAGEYVAPDLTPGTYTIRVESKGFKVFERQNVLLEVGKEVRVDALLQPGSSM